MATLHLHIGMHKTGTSAFQNACHNNQDTLRASGFQYHVGSGPNHSYFRQALMRNEWRAVMKELEEAFRANTCPNYIISGEDLSYLEEDELAFLAGIFKRRFDDVRVYAVLRPPVAYMHSATQQIIRDPRSTISSLFNRWDVTPSYERRFSKFVDLFGRSSLNLFEYGPDVLSRVAGAMGIQGLEFGSDNKSVSRWTVKMLSALKPFPSWDAVRLATARLTEIDQHPDEREHAPAELVDYWYVHLVSDCDYLLKIWRMPTDFLNEPQPTVRLKYYERFTPDEEAILRSIAA